MIRKESYKKYSLQMRFRDDKVHVPGVICNHLASDSVVMINFSNIVVSK